MAACPTCGRDLVEDAMATVRHTAEFAIPKFTSPEPIPPPAESPPPAEPAPPAEHAAAPDGVSCSWCGKPGAQVKKLLSGPGVHICNECVSLCYMVLRDELPDFA